jgi:hypothetical protein
MHASASRGIQRVADSLGHSVRGSVTNRCSFRVWHFFRLKIGLGRENCVSFLSEAVSLSKFNFSWEKLEEQLVTEALGQPPLVFKPILQLLTPSTNNINKPQAVINGTDTKSLLFHGTNPLYQQST